LVVDFMEAPKEKLVKRERKKRVPPSFGEIMRKLKKSGIEGSPPANKRWDDGTEVEEISTRIQRILGIFDRQNGDPKRMVYFVMYDIENNKVRALIAKYLLKKGCTRVQKSIFLADTERKVFDEIQKDLKDVQECYDNDDSILMVPVSFDLLQSMKMMGKNVDFDLILKRRNTLIF
jgi:CRISPR-associated endonuclease Cas2